MFIDYMLFTSGTHFVPTPKQVGLFKSQLPGVNLGVFSTTWIKRGTAMGPFIGRKLNVDDVDKVTHNANIWEVRNKYSHDVNIDRIVI